MKVRCPFILCDIDFVTDNSEDVIGRVVVVLEILLCDLIRFNPFIFEDDEVFVSRLGIETLATVDELAVTAIFPTK